MWAFANQTPRSFAPQQVWASSFGIGFILIVFTAIQAWADICLARIRHSTPHTQQCKQYPGRRSWRLGSASGCRCPGQLVPRLIQSLGDTAPFLVGLLAVCALAAMQSTGAAYMSTAGTMLTRDVLLHFFNPKMSDGTQKFWARLSVLVIVGLGIGCCDHFHGCSGSARRAGSRIWFSNVDSSHGDMLFSLAYQNRCCRWLGFGTDCRDDDGEYRRILVWHRSLGSLASDIAFRFLGYAV